MAMLSSRTGSVAVLGFTMAFWRAFLFVFSKYVIENDCEAEAIAGARLTFSSIYEFLESNRSVYEI